jgi:hypothetical protein
MEEKMEPVSYIVLDYTWLPTKGRFGIFFWRGMGVTGEGGFRG